MSKTLYGPTKSLPEQLYIVKNGKFDLKRFNVVEVTNESLYKPNTGIWTSTFNPDGRFASDWVKWCYYTSPGWIKNKDAVIITVDPEAKIYTVESYWDLRSLFLNYALNAGYVGQYIDWKKLAIEYDGLRITHKGEKLCRMTNPNMIGWDCESTIFFRMPFLKIEQYIGKLFRDWEK